LKESHKDESEYYAEQIANYRKQCDILQSRINKLYTDKLDGIISEEFWAEKHNEWNNELSMLLRKIDTNNNANHDYMELGIKLLELVENLYLRYISLSDIEKSKTLKIIFQNFYLDGEKASYTYKKPFNSFVEGNVCLLNGGLRGTRTPDQLIKSQLLYQLSYKPTFIFIQFLFFLSW
jgi:hypothetical protein